MEEKWKDIKGFEGRYQISNAGRIRSLDAKVNTYYGKRTSKGKVLSPYSNGHGYLMISLRQSGKRRVFYVHRLVAEYFIENPNKLPNVNHKDFNRGNNSVKNLEWITIKDNVRYSMERMRHPKRVFKPSNTGEKYIITKRGRYRLNIRKLHVDKTFKTLEEAKTFKEKIMEERGDKL